MSLESCQDCGARWGDAGNCEEIFGSFLVHDYTDPGYGEVHALTVAAYMVQHRRYSDEGLRWIAKQLNAVLYDGVSSAELREIARADARRPEKPGESGRTWKVTRPANAPALPLIAWSMTIVDVAALAHDAASYRAAVRGWAAVTLREMTPWLPT